MIEAVRMKRLQMIKKGVIKKIIVGLILCMPLIVHLAKYKPFSSVDYDEIYAGKNAYYTFEVLHDPYCSEQLGSKSEAAYYYYIAIVNAETDNPKVFTIDVDTDRKLVYKKVQELAGTGKTMTVYGTFGPYSDMGELEILYGRALTNVGVPDEYKESVSLPCFFFIRGVFPYWQTGLAILGFIQILFASIKLIRTKNGSIYNSLYGDVLNSEYEENEISEDYLGATSYTNYENIRVGRLYTYINIYTAKPQMILNKNILEVKHTKAGEGVVGKRFFLLNLGAAFFAGIVFLPGRVFSRGNRQTSYFGKTATDIYFLTEGDKKPKKVRTLASWFNLDEMYKLYKGYAPWIKTVYNDI